MILICGLTQQVRTYTSVACRASLNPLVEALAAAIEEGKSLDRALGGRALGTSIVAYVMRRVDPDSAKSFFFWASQQVGFSHNCYTFNTLLEVFVNSGRISEAREMLAGGFFRANVGSYNTLIQGICETRGEEVLEALELLYQMRHVGVRENPRTYMFLLRGIARAGMVAVALKCYRDVPIQLDVVVVTAFISSLCKTGYIDEALGVMSEMSSNIVTYNVLIDALCKGRRISEGFALFRKALLSGLKPNVVTYTSLIYGLCRIGEVDSGCSLLKEMLERGCAPNTVTYNTLANGYVDQGRAYDAFALLEQKSFKPARVTFGVIVKGLCKLGRLEEAYGVVEEMVSRGITPDVEIHTVLTDALCKQGKIDAAWYVFRGVVQAGFTPDVVIYSVLVDGFCKAGRIEEAFGMLQTMVENDCEPDVYTFTIVVDALCKARYPTGAYEVFEGMSKVGILPDEVAFDAMFNGLCKEGKMDQACEILRTKAGVFTYSSLLQGLCNIINRIDEALRLLKDMPRMGCVPNAVCFNVVMNGLCRARRVEEAYQVYRAMNDAGCVGDVITYNILLHGLCKVGRITEAYEHVESMTYIEGCSPNVVTYTTLIKGLCDANRVEEACRVYEKMVESVPPNEFTYGLLISGLCKAGEFERVNHVFEHMLSRNGGEYAEVLVAGLARDGRAMVAYEMVRQMMSKGFSPSGAACSAVLDALWTSGCMEEHRLLVDEIIKRASIRN